MTVWDQIFGTAQHARIDAEWDMTFRILYYLANACQSLPFLSLVAVLVWLYACRRDLVVAAKPGLVWLAFFGFQGLVIGSNMLAVEWPALGFFLLLRGISALIGLAAMVSLFWLVPALLNAPNRVLELEIEKAQARRQARDERHLKEKAQDLIRKMKEVQEHETLESRLKLQQAIDELNKLSAGG